MDIESRLAELTLEEKVRLVSGASVWRTHAIDRVGIPAMKVSDGPNGVRGDGGVSAAAFPVGVCLASTWDMNLIEALGSAIADEARSKGVHVVLGPTINIHRSPLGGRNFECYSEDPLLSGLLASAFTDGLQSKGIGACLKHYVCNDSEFERHTLSVEVDERTLREIYLRPFEIAIARSQPWTVMAAYNRINGVYACSHDYLVNEVLKGEWGYDGLVISDWWAAKEGIPNANGGLDLEMPGPANVWGNQLLEAVAEGQVSEQVIDDKVLRLLRVIARAQVAAEDAERPEQGMDRPEHRDLAYQLASDGMVLLKNSGVLPLAAGNIKRLAVIGPNTEDFRIMGGGSSSLKPHYVSSPLEALAEKLPGIDIVTARGCRTHKYVPEADKRLLAPALDVPERGLMCQFYHDHLDGEAGDQKRVSRGNIMLQLMQTGDAPRAMRATGFVCAQESGLHTFGLMSTGTARMYVNEELIIDNWTHTTPGDAFFGQSTAEKTASVDLSADEWVPISIEFEANPEHNFRAVRYGILPPDTEGGINGAVALAANADAVIMLVGTNDDWETEGNDREMLDLPGAQNELIEQVARVNPNTIVVNNSGSPVAMPWLDDAGAVLQAWFPGQEFGRALADILFGDTNPSGRLPLTFPVRMEDTPAYTNYPGEQGKVYYGERTFVGYRWYDSRAIRPLLAFGHGLSYTEFSYGELRVEAAADGGYQLTVAVTNTGKQAGNEVIQVYVSAVDSPVQTPQQALQAFDKVFIEPGAKVEVPIHLDNSAFAHWDVARGSWQVAPGVYEIRVGAASNDIRLTESIEILAP